jgi:hypothetical protein
MLPTALSNILLPYISEENVLSTLGVEKLHNFVFFFPLDIRFLSLLIC